MEKFVGMLLFLLLLPGCNIQKSLLYYPDRSVPTDSQLAKHCMRFWPSGRDRYRGFIGTMPEGTAKGTIIVLHGNAATAADRRYYLEPLRRLGYRVLLAEYPGYGKREGKLGEESFVRDARETIRLAAGMYNQPLYLLGESLGGAVAAAAAREAGVRVDGIILITPWDSLEAVAKEKFPQLAVRLFLTDSFDTIVNLEKFKGPVAVVAAERDTIIPSHHAQKLYVSFPGHKKIWTIPGADHNDWPDFITDTIWKEIIGFVENAV